MNTLIKSLLGLAFAVIFIAFIGLLTLTQWLDPNDYKDEIQNVAKEQGVSLKLEGDITWQFFPSIGLSIQSLALSPLGSKEEPIVRIGSLAASVKLMPLFNQEVYVDGIKIDQAMFNLKIDKQGRGNWEGLSQNSNAPSSTPAEQDSSDELPTQFNLAMQTLQISHSEFTLQDLASKQTFSLKELNLNSANLNLAKKAFPFSLEVVAHSSTLAAPLKLALKASIVGSEKSLSLDQLNITVDETTFKGQANVPDLSRGAFSLQLNGDHLNIDKYLVAATTNTAPTGATPGNAPAVDANAPLLPLDTLRALEFELQMGLQSLIAEGMKFSEIDISARAKDGVITLDKMNAGFYQGTIKANSTIDARG